MNSTAKPNDFTSNINTLFEKDTKSFKNLSYAVKELKRRAETLSSAIKDRKAELERIAREQAELLSLQQDMSEANDANAVTPVAEKTEETAVAESVTVDVKEEPKATEKPADEVESKEVAPVAAEPAAEAPKSETPAAAEPTAEVKPQAEPVAPPKPAYRPELRANVGEIKKFVPSKTYIPQENGGRRGGDRNNNNYNNSNGYQPRRDNNAPGGYSRPNNNTAGTGNAMPPAGTTYIPQAGGYKGKDPSKDKKKFDQGKGAAYDDKKTNKKSALRRELSTEEINESELNRRFKSKKYSKSGMLQQQTIVIEHATVNQDPVPIKLLAEKIGKPGTDIVKKLLLLGMFKNVNDSIDFDTASLISSDFNITLELKLDKTMEEKLEEIVLEQEIEDESKKVKRAPVVTIMGHVDHGKTSLLDYIRKANVASGEAGGITQHIGAYTIRLKGEKITFIDTPGHEAFTSMRARGAMVTDIAVIVVAADDSIMPQTKEAISHAKAANVPVIIAINKIDKIGADIEKVKVDLSNNGLLIEEWGGDVMCVPVSAKTGENVDKLLEDMLLLAEMNDLKANPKAPARGTIIEAKLDKNIGPVATVLVQNGTLKIADTVVAGSVIGKIKSMIDDKGNLLKVAGPSTPVSVLGFDEVPNAGDQIVSVDDRLAKQIAAERRVKDRIQRMASSSTNLEDIFAQMSQGKLKELNLIIKGDVQGSVEALVQELKKLSNEEVKVKIVHSGVGAVNESDVTLASTSNAIIIGFNVRPDNNAKVAAARFDVDIRNYRIIYDVINDINLALTGMLAPKFKENDLGKAEVREIFHITNVGTIAGCYVVDGKMERNANVRLLRDNVVIFEGKIASLKRMKDDTKEVMQGFECGLGIDGYNDVKKGDFIECYVMEQI